MREGKRKIKEKGRRRKNEEKARNHNRNDE